QSAKMSMHAYCHAVWDKIAHNSSHATYESVVSDTHELMDSRATAQNGVVSDRRVAANHHIIGKCDVIANIAIMRYMSVSQKRTVVANRSISPCAVRPFVHGHAFTDQAVRADVQLGGASLMLVVLRIAPQNCVRIDPRSLAKRRRARYNHMAHQFRIVANDGARLNMTERADRHTLPQFHALLYESGGVNECFFH